MHNFFCAILLLLALITTPTHSSAQNYEDLFRDFHASSLSRDDKRFLQAALAFEGQYNGLLDGDWGRLSQSAMERYSWAEFGTRSEDWHMATLAFGVFEKFKKDGWAVRHFDVLDLSMLYPYRAVATEPATESLVNWRHVNSSVAYSTGIHTADTVQRLHDYTARTHNSPTEIYYVRKPDFAVTSATMADGSVLYTRSNYVNGVWSTVMLSANRRDIPILNAIAASISVGFAPPIMFSKGGKLAQVIEQAIALIDSEPQSSSASRDSPTLSERAAPQKSTGTGFVVSESGHVLTNAHVVEGCTTLKFNKHDAKVISEASDFDLALLQVDGLQTADVARFSPSPARLNSDVTVIGYPLAGILDGLNVTRGAVSSQMGLGGDVSGMQITAPVQPGNSGGPVLAADGEVVGVVVSKLNAQVIADATGDIPQNVNFAIRGEIAKLFLFQHGIDPILGSSDTPISPVDLADLAATFTGFIECN